VCVCSFFGGSTLSPTSVGGPNYSDQYLIEITIRHLNSTSHTRGRGRTIRQKKRGRAGVRACV
jgi:hypothetical protein